MRSRIPVLVLMLALAATAGACKKQKPVTVPPPAEPAPTAPAEPVPTTPKETVSDFPPETTTKRDVDPSVDELNSQGVLKTVYFDYDQEQLRDDARATLQANAQWLRAHPGYKVRIEGNADDRGTIEYNLALGQRRADSVREYLGSLGATTGDLEVISYGEEKPVEQGESEGSRQKNRRADFVIVSKP
ncbi:MAG TPA: peptidoglycan-associated lipoprotein Pal [Candidatus Polarisedimenticolaceae bacterium]|nr:peptidoglycan-associated lipoprotein Pal [Candidatus Polarisedimenticolaceae bacterium]